MKTRFVFFTSLLCAAIATLLISLAVLTPAHARSTPPMIAWSPSTNGTFDYGMVIVGQTASQTFTLTNSGGSATGMLSISLLNSTAFAITSDACTGTALGPGKSCAVTVQFATTTAGVQGATLSGLGVRPAIGPASITLTGTGVAAVARHIYWTNGNTGTIGRANLDGSNPNQFFISEGAFGVAVDAEHIYWTNPGNGNPGTGAIGRANLDGSNANQGLITGASFPEGVAVDAQHIYWTNIDGSGNGTIGRADLDGSNVNQSFITGMSFPFGVAVDAEHIYWGNGFTNAIGRADLDGSNVNQSFITGPGVSTPRGLAVDAEHIYWTNDSGKIARADLDGSNVNPSFIDVPDFALGVAVDAEHIYWPNEFTETIGRADLDGSNVNQSFITGAFLPVGVAVDR